MDDSILNTLVEIAEKAGSAISNIHKNGITKTLKTDRELVTNADKKSHEIINEFFREVFPNIPSVMEESSAHHANLGTFLVADELDGTSNYAAGSDNWGIMLALIEDSPTRGIIHLPEKKITIAAEKGKGCWMNGRKVSLQSQPRISEVIVGIELNAYLETEDWARLKKISSAVRATRCLACIASSIYELLSGVTHIYVNHRGGKIWDFAAPAVAITEAGGIVAASDGMPLKWDQIHMNFLASASEGLMHEVLRI